MAAAFLRATRGGSVPPPKSPKCPYEDEYEVEIRGSDRQALTQHSRRLETVIRNALAENNHERIGKIVWQLCHDYAYAVHQPHARNGGLIGLAAAAIALGAVSNLTRRQRGILANAGTGCSTLPERDSTSSVGMLLRPRC